MSYRTIRSAQSAVWPAVVQSLRLRRAQRDAALAADNPTRAAATRARLPWNRVVMDETVWAIAKADLLNTPEQAAVIAAAREWVRVVGPDLVKYPEDFEPVDFKLWDAVQALAAVPENFPDE